jgi:hypothetical protein
VGVPTGVASVSVPGPSITRSPLPFEIVPIVRFVSSVVVPVTLKKAVLPEPLATLFPLQFEATLQEPVVPAAADHVPLWAHAIRSQTNSPKRSPIIMHGDPTTISALRVGGAPRLLLTVFETTKLPKRIIDDLLAATDGIITASEFNRQGLVDSGYTKPVHVVPHTEGRWWWENAPARTITDRFVFTYVGTMNPRKNALGALAAYKAAFPEESKDTAFVLKTFATNEDQIAGLEAASEGRSDIWIWNDLWKESKIQWLHANTDVFVSAHCGEGWGVGPFKSKLLGKRVIYTDFSAVKTRYASPAIQTRWNYFLLGWEMRGVQ